MRGLVLGLMLLLAAVPTSAAELRPYVPGSLAAIREANAGRPFILAFWSINCVPCIAEMPLWRRIVEDHPRVGLVLVATDPIAEADRIWRVLRRYRLDEVEAWAFADDFVERLRFEADPRWRGELPRTQLTGADGRVETVSGLLSEDRLMRWLRAAE